MTEDANKKFLRVEISRSESKVCMQQPHLIERIIDGVGFGGKNMHSKPTPSTDMLHKNENGENRKDEWSYQSVIGMLNYLAHTTRPDIMMAIH